MSNTNREGSDRTAAADRPTARRGSRRRLRMFVVFTALALPVALLVVGEVVVRGYLAARGWTPNCYATSLDLFRPHDQLGCDLKPGFRLQSGTWRISVNSLGFRGPEVATNKPPGVTRIAILGGSSVFGYLVSDGQEAARLLEDQLNAGGFRAEVINSGVPSYNLYQTALRFRERVASLEPDIVILYLGWNDLGYLVSDTPGADRYRVRPVAPAWQRLLGKSSLYGLVVFRLLGQAATLPAADPQSTARTEAGSDQFRRNLAQLISTAQEHGARVVVCGQVTAAHPEAHADLRPFLASDPARRDGMIELFEWVRETLRETAEQAGAKYVDANRTIPPQPEFLRDYIHLSEEGERRLARLFEQLVRAES